MVRKRYKTNSIIRIGFVAIAVLTQVGWLLLMILKLNNYSAQLAALTNLLAAVVVLRLVSRDRDTSLKLPWIVLILALPVMGLSLYLLFRIFGDPFKAGKRLEEIRTDMSPYMQQDEALARLEEKDPAYGNYARYLAESTGSPVYENTRVTYYPQAAQAFEAMKEELEKAKSFIFMEYFILEDGESFQQLRQLLARKAKEGVQVRLLYDDLGSVGYSNFRFARSLNDDGICCRAFNPAVPVMNLFMNHRDHRKITVIDGKVGFTGGYNLADEYFGIRQPFGHWKDTGLKLEGQAVRSLTATFLELWNITTRQQENFGRYLSVDHRVTGEGFVQPFGDDPLGEERAMENIYLNLIGNAKNYIWFMTPYLIITDEMARALTLAAKRGVDVRIVTPGVPDKKTVYQVTRSYYSGLVRRGVRIFEYSPGFCHGKQCVCDGEVAVVGTSNLDYRSLYLHFENDVVFGHCGAVGDIQRDFEEIFSVSREVTEKYRNGLSGILMLWQCILRLFAPMM